MQPTTEQAAIIAEARTAPNLLINACAGSGKTTTLKLLAKRLPVRPALALAFNKRNAQDLEKAMPGHVACKTFNGLGHGILRQELGNVKLDSRKSSRLIREHCGSLKRESFFGLRTVFNAARAAGFIPADDEHAIWGHVPGKEDWINLCYECDVRPAAIPLDQLPVLLEQSNNEAMSEGIIDFDDQIYLPLVYVAPLSWPSFSTILVDEAQDLSPGNHEALKRLTRWRKPDYDDAGQPILDGPPSVNRLIAVGDRAQAIYGFRGADTRSMETLRNLFGMKELELSVSFRCPHAIVEQAQKNLPSMKALFNAPEGKFERNHDGWTLSDLPAEGAVLCRNNAPLVSLALRLFMAGRGVNFLGVNLSGQIKSTLDECQNKKLRSKTTATEALAQLEDYRRTKTEELVANNLERLIARHEDKCACVRALFEQGGCTTIAEAKDRIEELFSENNSRLCFSTGHRSKGFEWEDVFWLDPFLIPSRHAKKAADAGDPEPFQQEMNLRYVIITRASRSVTLIDTDKLEIEQ